MKKSNIFAANAAKNFHRKDMLLNIKGQYMKESNSLADNVENNFPARKILLKGRT